MRVIVALVLAFLTSHVRAEERGPSCHEIAEQIRTKGASTVLAELWANDERLFLPVAAKIATGESCWLRIATALMPFSDAGSSEELEGAMSRALATHPERVLPYLSNSHPFPLESVCEGVQIAVDEDESAVRAWLRETEVALRRTSGLSPSNERKRQLCLAIVRRELRPSHHMRPN